MMHVCHVIRLIENEPSEGHVDVCKKIRFIRPFSGCRLPLTSTELINKV